MNERMLKIFSANKELITPTHLPGEYESDGKTFLKFACLNGYLDVKELQLEGKKKLPIGDFLRGYRES
jgi:methionyl-tRNA formyltransferase